MPRPGTSTTRGPAGSIGNSTGLVVEIPFVVAAIPVRVLLHAAYECGLQLVGPIRLGIELDDEGLVLRVDQMVGTGSADLTDFRGPFGRRERECLGATIDLEYDAVSVGEEGTAERGKGLSEEGGSIPLPQLRGLATAQTESTVGRSVNCLGSSGDELERRPGSSPPPCHPR